MQRERATGIMSAAHPAAAAAAAADPNTLLDKIRGVKEYGEREKTFINPSIKTRMSTS